VAAFDRVVQRALLEAHLLEVAARLLHRLLHGDRDFLRLALAHADAAVAVADDGQRGERHDASALHDLRDAVDADHLLAEPVAAVVLLLLTGCVAALVRHGSFPRT
jgi:hypothetical protein